MLIEKIINNNIISAYDVSNKEVIVMGRGIGFGAKPGDSIEESKIEKIFQIKNQNVADRLKELLADMPLEHIQVSNEVITFAKGTLGLKLNQSIYVTLTDHINFTITRHNQGIHPENALLWEIKRFYNREYKLGKYAIDIIKSRLNIKLPEAEAGFIALHFINAEYGDDIRVAGSFPRLIEKMMGIIKEDFSIEFDEDSLDYERLVSHAKFLLQRVYQKLEPPAKNPELVDMFIHKYIREYQCAEKIARYIMKEAGCNISQEEKAYLAVHIRRITIE